MVHPQINDRNAVKEMLQQLLPQFKRQVNKELEEKTRLLQRDPTLFQLYKDLVVSQVITADEFWANHSSRETPKHDSEQQVGVSAAFLADIKPQTDGCNGLRYNLTMDVIESIFRTYPAVKKKHADNVPDKMSESDFWTRFFQSHYFHRDRLTAGGSKDLFAECAKSDEKELQNQIDQGIENPMLDLNLLKDKSLHEGYGNSAGDNGDFMNANNLSMIRRFNHHSTMVLKACESQGKSPTSLLNGHAKGDNVEQPHKKIKLRDKIVLEDLEATTEQAGTSLNLTKVNRYYSGPTPVLETIQRTQEDLYLASCQLKNEISEWKPNLSQVLNSNTSVGVLAELSPGGILMKGSGTLPANNAVSTDAQAEMRQLNVALSELLRHFWSCFPVTSPDLEQKLLRMKAALERFHLMKLHPFRDKLIRAYHCTNDVTRHAEEMLEVALKKFNTWHAKKLSRR